LNGPPRAGKTSIATAIQERFDGVWMYLGMDGFKAMTPPRYQPGIGLRPGGERPDLEPLVATLYRGMYQAIADHSRLGVNVVADATHHEHYSRPLRILATCAELLRDLPLLFVAVRCPIDVIRERRRAAWGGTGYAESSTIADPVDLWQRTVDATGPYDLTLDTSMNTPEECADLIGLRLADLPVPSTLQLRTASSASTRH
jgi:chloramphenicol 3-O phosphotransferase